jgi:hypothetical protein
MPQAEPLYPAVVKLSTTAAIESITVADQQTLRQLKEQDGEQRWVVARKEANRAAPDAGALGVKPKLWPC